MLSDVSEVEHEDLMYELDAVLLQLAEVQKQNVLLLQRVNALQSALDKHGKGA